MAKQPTYKVMSYHYLFPLEANERVIVGKRAFLEILRMYRKRDFVCEVRDLDGNLICDKDATVSNFTWHMSVAREKELAGQRS